MATITLIEFRELSADLSTIKSAHQTIGKVGIAIRRCKAGSAQHLKYEALLTKLQRESDDASDRITNSLLIAATAPEKAMDKVGIEETVNETAIEAEDAAREPSSKVKDLLTLLRAQPQRQDSLQDQLRDLQAVADRLGMYDAADHLRSLDQKRTP